MRSQLTQECSLKQEAFQHVDERQCQVYDLEAAVSQRNATAGEDRLCVVTRFLGEISLVSYVSVSLNPSLTFEAIGNLSQI